MTFREKVDGDCPALDRGAFHRDELNNPVVLTHIRAGENSNPTAALIKSRAGYVHSREKML